MLIHRYWTGSNQPAAHPLCYDWTDDQFPPMIVNWLDERMALAGPAFAIRHRANMARWYLLAEHGGVYMDFDIDPEIAVPESPFTASHEDGRRCVRFMGFPLHHPAPIAAIEWLNQRHETGFDANQFSSVIVSGDGLLARVWVD